MAKSRAKKSRRSVSSGRHHPAGTAPGVLNPQPDDHPSTLHLIAYDDVALQESSPSSIESLERELAGAPRRRWLNVEGTADVELLGKVGALFGVHPLALEDAVSTHQRPKVEEYGDVLFIALRMPRPGSELDLEQLSLFLGPDWVLTVQERPGDAFGPVRERLHKAGTRLRRLGADYLAYALLDAIIDAYFPLLERKLALLEDIEEQLSTQDLPRVSVSQIHAMRADLHLLRRVLWSTRDAVGALVRGELQHFGPETQVYLRDCYDHCIQLLDMAEAARELGVSLMELHLAASSHHLNQVMKMLTIISTIFIPLSFVAGVYGMNFDIAFPTNMPELRWEYGYLFTLAVMALVAAGFLWYFRRKGWLGAPPPGQAQETETSLASDR